MEVKNTNLNWKKKMLYGINSKLNIAEEKIRQFENIALEIFKIRHREEKEWKKMKKTSVTYGTMSGYLTYV